ncbi:GntR family transcriptional regulator [Lichenibacterium ramalinae]|uniref:GntR family transcriptional regulator n=1 Tax=Lichenibacterium ramalinae TaxID=2316527 RepID=A0A4Q2RF53_9HYPH|nr:GntR family transcriptional regulator [Lichenibacterium ramalinae]RYB05314.1 GntR family transcriptional regulator [Lichenibacterium ramalinae]
MTVVRLQQGLPFSPVSRATIQDHVYGKLRESILNGAIEPGRTVTVQSLSEAFGCSAMPVREAMHRLVAEKALTVVAGRSVGIPHLTPDRLEDLRRVRAEVEGMAAAWAASSLPDEALGHLDALIAEMDGAKAERDRARYVPANRDFHFTIYRAAGSETLLAIIESLWLQIGPYFNILNATENWSSANLEHKAMRSALARRDGAAVRAALVADIDGAAEALGLVLTRPDPIAATSRRSKRLP